MFSIFTRFAKDESGATAIEYGLIAALLGIGIVAASKSLGSQISNTFNGTATALKNA